MALSFAKLGSTLVLWDIDENGLKKGLIKFGVVYLWTSNEIFDIECAAQVYLVGVGVLQLANLRFAYFRLILVENGNQCIL